MGEYIKAYQALSKAIELNSRYGYAFLVRGDLLMNMGFKVEGREDLLKAGFLGFREAYDILNDD